MISPALLSLARCPDCGGALESSKGSRARCSGCGRIFDGSRGYLDLRPSATFAEQTKYLDEALHADARHESVAPPLLGSRIRNGRLREFLNLSRGDRVLDLGCGSGRALIWNSDTGAALTGIDISPFFAREAIDRSQLLLGDLRRLPLRDGAFDKAWSLDVFEHLSPQALQDVLREAHRVLAPGGALFIYTHVRKNGPVARGVRLVNRLAHACERLGLIDLRQERLRKSDHLNPIADHDELRAVLAGAGFEIERITYYTPVVGAFIENVLVRMGERMLTRALQRSTRSKVLTSGVETAGTDSPARLARTSATARIRRRGPTYWVLRLLSAAMMVDIALFGRMQSGPFFALLRRSRIPSVEPGGPNP
jgi:SAM-dependent methyltransferase